MQLKLNSISDKSCGVYIISNNIALALVASGLSKAKACIGLNITPYALTDIIRGKSQIRYATELLSKFKEFI